MIRFVSFAFAFLLPLSAFAADPAPAPKASRGVMRYDTNNDGFVDRSEWAAAQEARFKQLDTDHDGKLTQAELFPSRPSAETAPNDRQSQRQATYFRLLDTDKDGVVTKAEFMAQADRNFARCDLDKDGRINTAECRQALRRRPTEPASATR